MTNRIDKPCYTDLYKDLLAPERKIKKSRKEISKDQRERGKALIVELKNSIRSLIEKLDERDRVIDELNDQLEQSATPNREQQQQQQQQQLGKEVSHLKIDELQEGIAQKDRLIAQKDRQIKRLKRKLLMKQI